MTEGAFPFGGAPFGDFLDDERTLTIEERIERALFTHAFAMLLPGVPRLAWQNKTFPGKDDTGAKLPKPTTYVEVRHLRNDNTRLYMRGSNPHYRQGILQMTVRTPLKIGANYATAIAGEIVRQTPADLALHYEGTKVRIQRMPDIGDALPEDATWMVVVSARYDCLE